MYRFHPRIEAAINLVRSDDVGAVKSIRSSFSFKLSNPDNIRLSPEFGGGSLVDVGCYCVNVSRTLIGKEPIEVQASAIWGESGVDVVIVATLRFPGNIFAQFNCALTLPHREYYEVVGEAGRFSVPAAFLPGADDVEVVASGLEPEIRSFKGVDEYKFMIERFADCILADKHPRFSAVEAAANIRTLEALYRSARHQGRLESL